ncbi:hypothetical protein A7K94_0217830, partial [Modestobacter sp. VKM Ac-2676]
MAAQRQVVVVGGGVLGVATAAQLAARGARVTLLTEGELAGGASGRSLSWLNSAGTFPAGYHRLRMLGLERYRALDVPWVRFDGGLRWGDGVPESFAHHREIGYPAEWLTPAQVADRVPGLDATAVPDDGAEFNPRRGVGRAARADRPARPRPRRRRRGGAHL